MTGEKNVLIVVHGMGEQAQHATLLEAMPQFVDLMQRRGSIPDWEPEVSGNQAFANQSDAQLEYRNQTWQFAEYWWARGFRAASAWKIAPWIAIRLTHHLCSMLKSMRQAGQDLTESLTNPRAPKDPLSARVYNAVAVPLYSVLVVLLAVLTPLLVLGLVALGYVRLIPGVPSFVGYVQNVLSRVGIDFLGDIYVYLNDPIQAAMIRGGLEHMIREAVGDDEVRRVVLFAHSTGNMICYDALAHLHATGDEELQGQLRKVTAFVGAGSILPMVWNESIVRRDDDRFRKPLPKGIHWYHLWTRFDIGPAGPLQNVPANVLEQGPTPVSRRVNNADDLFFDHTGYWTNVEQVHTLLLEEMGGMDSANDFWRGRGYNEEEPWRSRSDQTWADFNLRRKAVALLATVRLATLSTLLLGFPLLLWFNGWAKGTANFLQIGRIGEALGFSWLSGMIADPDLSVLSTVGLAAVVTLALFAGVYLIFLAFKLVLWKHWFDRARHRRDRDFDTWRRLSRERSAP